MTKTQTFIAAMGALAAGVGMLITGVLIKNDALTATGSSLIGVAVGALGLPRVQDAVSSNTDIP